MTHKTKEVYVVYPMRNGLYGEGFVKVFSSFDKAKKFVKSIEIEKTDECDDDCMWFVSYQFPYDRLFIEKIFIDEE